MTIDSADAITPAARTAILAAVGVGARLSIACGYARVDPADVKRLIAADAQFKREIFQAQCRHQVRNLLKLEQATQVQAAVFALERRWPGRFARPRPQQKRKRRRRVPVVDLSGFGEEVLLRLEKAFAAAGPAD